MSTRQFRLDVSKFVADAKANLNQVARRTVIEIGNRLVDRSPVGDRELWAINASTIANREAFNIEREAAGQKPLTERTLKKRFPTKGPAGYVGGRFRASWQLTQDAPAIGNPYPEGQSAYPSAAQVKAELEAAVPAQVIGVLWFANNLPYAQRLDDGFSTQAPAGIVSLVMVEFGSIVSEVVKEVKA